MTNPPLLNFMQDNSTVTEINKDLLVHGYNIYNQPNFRVVFSADQTEKRRGTYAEYSGSIFLRNFVGVKEIPKYPYFKTGRWILERWAGPELTYHPDIVSALNGDYVCVYVFQDVNMNYLPPHRKVAEIVVKHLLNPRNKSEALIEDRDKELKADKVEEDRIFEGIRSNYEKTATEVETLSNTPKFNREKERFD